MLVVFFAGSTDVVFYDTLNEDLLQHGTDRIEPAHICSEIETAEPWSCCDLREKEILNHTDNAKTADKDNADDRAYNEIFLNSLFSRVQTFEMDLKSREYRKDDRKDHQVAFHHPRKDICVIFNESGSYNMREDLNCDNLTRHCRQKEQQC